MRYAMGCGTATTARGKTSNEYRSADGCSERFPELAAELVRLKVDLIVTKGTPAVQTVKATKTVPVVMAATGASLVIVTASRIPGAM
jgi:ABC-type uncharacterized transport system substrate-binding protein